jgi:hypothetical protein
MRSMSMVCLFLAVAAVSLYLVSAAPAQWSRNAGNSDVYLTNLSDDVGIGINNPARQLHVRGENAIFRLDRWVNSPGFIISRMQYGIAAPLKTFHVGVKAWGVDAGRFFIEDLHTAEGGDGDVRLAIDEDGNVGIGTTTPQSDLHVYDASGVADLELESGAGGAYFKAMGSSGQNSGLTMYEGGDAKALIYWNGISNYLALSSSIAVKNNQVGIGTTTPGYKLDVVDNRTAHAMRIWNDGNNNNNQGLAIQCGSDTGTGTNRYISFYTGDATARVGEIEATNGTVVYGPFTAKHPSSIPEKDNQTGYPYGTVMCLTSTRPNPERSRQVRYEVEPSRKACDKAVFGIYAGKDKEEENLHSIYAIGDGQILVTEEGGDIEIGDYLTTSSKEGHAMKQGDGILRNYTVAKSQEKVVWADIEGDSRLIACTYHAQ